MGSRGVVDRTLVGRGGVVVTTLVMLQFCINEYLATGSGGYVNE